MRLAEFERIQRKHMDAANEYFKAQQDPDTDPVFLRYLRGVAEEAETEYLRAWKVYQAQATKEQH